MNNIESSGYLTGLGPMHLLGEVDDSIRRPETSPFVTLTQNAGISFKTENDKNLLLLERDIEYPEPKEGEELAGLLLSGEKGSRGGQHLELPDNYVTMAQALNDTIGDNVSDRSRKMMRSLFSEVGESLARVASVDCLVPEQISYKNIIFSREEKGPKLLPPIKFISFEPARVNSETAKKHVIDSLYDSLQKGAANSTQQRNIADVFAGFFKSFDW